MNKALLKLDLNNPAHVVAAAAFFNTLSQELKGVPVVNGRPIEDRDQQKPNIFAIKNAEAATTTAVPAAATTTAVPAAATTTAVPAAATTTAEPAAATTTAVPAAATTQHIAATWSDADMKPMKSKDLKVVCDELAIDYEAVPGVNTNAKLRKLILSHFAGFVTPVVEKVDAAVDAAAAAATPVVAEVVTAIGDIKAVRDEIRKLTPVNARAGHKEVMRAKLDELGAGNTNLLTDVAAPIFLKFLKSFNTPV